MSRFDEFVSRTGWYNREAWNSVQEACWLLPGEDGIAVRKARYAPFFQKMGADVRIDQGCRFSFPWRIVLDDGARLNREVIIEGSSAVRIGRNARIGHRVFIHSANHEVSPDGAEALFERPHVFLPVWIGDNVLISASVTILPGAVIEDGSFVAAGAVVTSKRFVGPVRLAGVPAEPLQNKNGQRAQIAEPAPDLVFLAPKAKPRTIEALKLLATALGCPQVAVLADDVKMPPSARAIIAFDNAVAADDPAIPVFTVAPGQQIAADAWLKSRGWSTEINREFVINGYGCTRSLANAAAATYFYASNAYLKGTPEKRSEVAGEWGVCIALALIDLDSASIWKESLDRLGLWVSESGAPLTTGDSLDAFIRRELSRPNLAELSGFFESPTEKSFAKVRAQFQATPHLLPLWTWKHRTHNPSICAAFIEVMRPHMKTAVRLAALGCAYALTSESDNASGIAQNLLGDEWLIDESCLIRALPGSSSLAIQPVVAALLIWALSRETGASSVVPRRQHLGLSWSVVQTPASDSTDISDAFFDRERRVISASLLDNWLFLQELPECGEAHYYLADAAYQDPCARVEAVWSNILKEIALSAGCPYLKLRPWPHGYDFAFSLRYDVDRDSSASQVSNILRIQKDLLGAPCGSWYFFADAKFNPRVRNILRGWNQENARHFCRPEESFAGGGATAHSGSNSEYWRGRATVEGLAAAGAAYGEGMLSRWSAPRPGWLGDSRAALWLTPLHFPLEGSTADQTTEYFDQRLQAFRAQIALGGHVIIGSHPDCNQEILDEILKREDLSRAWAVPVGVAVERCRSVLHYGAVRIVNDGADLDTKTFVSDGSIADLAIDVFLPGETAARTISTQLVANVPRTVRITPEQ